jgi:hypothetical protein
MSITVNPIYSPVLKDVQGYYIPVEGIRITGRFEVVSSNPLCLKMDPQTRLRFDQADSMCCKDIIEKSIELVGVKFGRNARNMFTNTVLDYTIKPNHPSKRQLDVGLTVDCVLVLDMVRFNREEFSLIYSLIRADIIDMDTSEISASVSVSDISPLSECMFDECSLSDDSPRI